MLAMLQRYRAVLAVPGVGRLFAAALLARLPQGMSSLAILLVVRDATHSYALAGLAIGAYALGTAAGAPLQGALVDRLGRVRVLEPSALGQAAALVGLVLAARAHSGAAVLVVLAGMAGALMPPIAASVRALLGEMIDDRVVRESAYALESVLQELVWITGPLLVALVIGLTSPSGAVLLLAAIAAGGTTLLVCTPAVQAPPAPSPAGGRVGALRNGALRALLGPIALTGFSLGAIEVGLPSLALHAGSRGASGVLLALWSLGSVAGGLWYGARIWSSPLATRYRALLIAATLLSAPLIAARSLTAGMLCSLLAGAAIAPLFSCQYALVGRIVPPGSETESFTWVSAALIGGIAAGSAAGGAAIAPGGQSAPFVLSFVACALAAGLALGLRRRVQGQWPAARATASSSG